MAGFFLATKPNMIISAPLQDRSHKNGLRPINLNRDIPQVLKLLEMVFGNSLDADGQRMLSQTARASQGPAFLMRLNPATSRMALGFVWEDNGRIVGNVTILTTKTPGRYLVVNVAVHPDYRRQGIARNLMQQVSQMVEARKGSQILLQVVQDNTSAINLYKSLNYQVLGSVTTWHATIARLRPLADEPSLPRIRDLRGNEWPKAFELDRACLHPDLNWPEQLKPDTYKLTMWNRIANFINGRHSKTWVTNDAQNQLTGMFSILSEWGQSHYALLRIHPAWRGQLERPLTAKLILRLQNMPRRNIRLDHPAGDKLTSDLLREANFNPRRSLTHMRLDL
ncbi:MAG: GNAT family N-acetyltransferase [Chloroflexi bacterium]|nr:GNAT family N-acetyltransferase [Chloroflexota bacterium]